MNLRGRYVLAQQNSFIERTQPISKRIDDERLMDIPSQRRKDSIGQMNVNQFRLSETHLEYSLLCQSPDNPQHGTDLSCSEGEKQHFSSRQLVNAKSHHKYIPERIMMGTVEYEAEKRIVRIHSLFKSYSKVRLQKILMQMII